MVRFIGKFLVKVFSKIYICYTNYQLKILYGNKIKIGNKVSYRRGFKVKIEEIGTLSIGDYTSFNYNCSISCLRNVEIGEYCLIGENVKFYDHNHRFSDSTKRIIEQGFTVGSIRIGNNCWIGSNVTLLKGVTIGDNVVIGANCLINKSIPSNTIVKNQNHLQLEQRRN